MGACCVIVKGTKGWDVDFWLDKSAGIRKRKRGLLTKSAAQRWVNDQRREYARSGRDPGERYQALVQELGEPVATRIDAAATPEQKKQLSKLAPEQVRSTELAGEAIQSILSHAPGNNEAIGGLKVITANGWFAARPSGTEDIYKIYAESFLGDAHLQRLVAEAQELVNAAIAPSAG